MSVTTSTSSPRSTARRSSSVALAVRWLISFAGFPIGGLAAMIITGPVDGPVRAVAGGLITGLVLGAVQSWALRLDRSTAARWTTATAAGLAVGLTAGAAAVGYATDLQSLVVQGAVTGIVVGLSQAVVLRRRMSVGRLAVVWPFYLSIAWALGWLVTTAIGVDVERQFTTFGSAGAVTVALLTLVLPLRSRS